MDLSALSVNQTNLPSNRNFSNNFSHSNIMLCFTKVFLRKTKQYHGYVRFEISLRYCIKVCVFEFPSLSYIYVIYLSKTVSV